MQQQFRLLYPQGYDVEKERRMKDHSFVRTLKLDDMVVLVKESYRGFSDLSLEKYFSMDPEVLDYRLAIVEDLTENPKLYQAFCESVNMIFNISDLRRLLSADFSVDSAIGSARYLEMYQEIVDHFARALAGSEIRSRGLRDFREQILGISESAEYRSLSGELPKMRTNFGYLKSVTIGINLDDNLRPKEAGLISANQREFHSGTVLDRLFRKKPAGDGQALMSALYPLSKGLSEEEKNRLNYAISSALNTIFVKSLRDFEPLIQSYFKVNTVFFVSLLDDIRFLTAGVKFILDMRKRGYAMCRPSLAPMEEKKCDLKNVYNPMLALRGGERIVLNDFRLDENGRFFIVTGPNHGGKSVFAHAVGMAQALCQLGLFVPAERAVMSPVSGIYTHFPSYDDEHYKNGGLEGECMRLSEILQKLTDTDMILMDETFASTSGLEAGYIASEVLTGIGVIGCCGLFVTHLHVLPQQVGQFNSHPGNRARIDNLVALMENREDGTRSYRIVRATPDGMSYAKDIAGRYGLDLEGILTRREQEVQE